jgi:hypothetical protein
MFYVSQQHAHWAFDDMGRGRACTSASPLAAAASTHLINKSTSFVNKADYITFLFLCIAGASSPPRLPAFPMTPVPPVPGRLQLLLLVAALLALLAPAPVYSHGSLTVPRSWNVIRPINGETWWNDHGNGFGSAQSHCQATQRTW